MEGPFPHDRARGEAEDFLKDFFKKLYRDVRFYYRAFDRLELHNKAASLSYYTVISLFPMMLLLTAAFGFIMPGTDWMPGIRRFVDDALPLQAELVVVNLESLIRNKATVSWFGAISLLLSAQMLYVNMDHIINRLLHEEKSRHFLMTRLFFFPWLGGMVFMLFTPVIFEVVEVKTRGFGWEISALTLILVKSGFVIASFLMFSFMMTVLPIRRIQTLRVVEAGALFAFTLQAGKFAFKQVTVGSLDRYNLVYGSLASIVLGLLWIFYFYSMFLFFVYWAGRKRDPQYLERNRARGFNGMRETTNRKRERP